MFKLYDISMTIQPNMQVYKNKEVKRPILGNVSNFTTGKVYETQLILDAHTGTHIDAPLHMIKNGATMDSIDLASLVGPARVLDLTHVVDSIGQFDLEPFAIKAGEWLLFKTKNSFSEDLDFIYLKEDGAHYLRGLQIKGVGTDGLGLERAQPNYATHRTLLGAGIHIVEGLRFKDVPAGNYFMVIAPLKLAGIEAAPARAFLLG
jgi:arylformamidase